MLSPLGVFLPADVLLARETCRPGDLIEIDRKLYAHWAVYIGNSEVVHLPEPDLDGEVAVVERSRLVAVAGGCLVRVNNKQVPARERGLTSQDAVTVVRAAANSVGTSHLYNIVVSNSEHFVTRLKYGSDGWSDQAKAMRHSMSSLSPSPSSPLQVAKAHLDIWSEITAILGTSPPSLSPTSSSPPPSLHPLSASHIISSSQGKRV